MELSVDSNNPRLLHAVTLLSCLKSQTRAFPGDGDSFASSLAQHTSTGITKRHRSSLHKRERIRIPASLLLGEAAFGVLCSYCYIATFYNLQNLKQKSDEGREGGGVRKFTSLNDFWSEEVSFFFFFYDSTWSWERTESFKECRVEMESNHTFNQEGLKKNLTVFWECHFFYSGTVLLYVIFTPSKEVLWMRNQRNAFLSFYYKLLHRAHSCPGLLLWASVMPWHGYCLAFFNQLCLRVFSL